VTLRKLLLLPLAALLGAALVVLPALAASSEAKLEVNENCVANDWPCWATPGSGSKPQPASSVTIASGGTVTFTDDSNTPANIAWIGAAPACSASVPVSPAPAASKWEGTCKFEAPGTYKYESSTLYFAYTKYEVVVTGAATSGPTTSTGAGTTSTSTGTTYTSTSTSGASTPGSGGAGGAAGGGTSAGSLLVGSASSAIKLASVQHGRSIHGSVDVSHVAAGGKLEVQLLATRASIADTRRSSRVQVGRVARSALHAGAVSFVVPLDARARAALDAHGRLELDVKLVLSPLRGSPVTLTRSVTVRA
jgi:plastocyanin